MKEHFEIKQLAKNTFAAQRSAAIGAFAAFFFIANTVGIIYKILTNDYIPIVPPYDIITWNNILLIISMIRVVIGLFIAPPVTVGHNSFSLRVWRGEEVTVRGMFRVGFSNAGHKIGGFFLMNLFIFLWSLLLIIPGIIKSYAYFMAPYILADCPEVEATDVLNLSKRMTNGYKGDIFLMQLSFFGWWLLSFLTLGALGIVYVGPYYRTSLAGMYDELKRHALENGIVSPEELGMAPLEIPLAQSSTPVI